MDTFLFVRGAAEVADAVVRCWASAFGGRALSYRRQQGLGVEVGAAALDGVGVLAV
ncbi:MAG: PEP/pyruvate-binding domain-containing protein, partial [Planctomycetota bacterium]